MISLLINYHPLIFFIPSLFGFYDGACCGHGLLSRKIGPYHDSPSENLSPLCLLCFSVWVPGMGYEDFLLITPYVTDSSGDDSMSIKGC